MRRSPEGRSGVGLIAFAVLTIFLVIVVAAVAFEVGHQVAIAQRALGSIP